ncbi:cellulose binding domain-containing protein [Paenibacillus sp. FSL H8-0537]|uniref:cellulose binding domain-containing protein n=2 Tax=Paenibacillus sp. FSL H8-0537 TaxID=2921399 RepID=UPI0031014973
MKQQLKRFMIFSLALAMVCGWTTADTKASAADSDAFVTTAGSKFQLDGEDFYFAGTNNYYFHYKSQKMVDDVFADMVAMNLKVIRIWGFHNGQPQDNAVLQPTPGVYDESGFTKLDYAIYKAGQSGVKLVIPFVNNWDDFGGMNQYVAWFNAGSHDAFYTNASIKQAYKNYVNYMLNRVNTYTGIKYKDDPAIMAWELANEPRAQSDTTGNKLVNWADEMSTYVKSLDANHLVAVGDEGFYNIPGHSDWMYGGGEGVDWERLIALPNIDYGTFHLYPDHWNRTAQWGTQWIIDHIEDGNAAQKPVVLEEFGYQNQATRNQVYAAWLGAVEQYGGAGSQFWILTGIQDNDTLYPDYDGFRVVYPSATATLLTNHANVMNAKSGGGGTGPITTVPAAPQGVTATAGNGQAALSWQAVSGATSYNIKRAASSTGPFATVGTTSSNSYVDTGLVNGTTYYYAVSAVNSVGESVNSLQASATPTLPSTGTGELKVQYKNGDSAALDNQLKPQIRIVNSGTTAVPLHELTIRYWYSSDGSQPQTFDCDFATVGCSNLSSSIAASGKTSTNADTYLEISFGAGAGNITAGGHTGEMQTRIHKNDWTNYIETNDYSYNTANTAFADASRVTLYRSGVLVWGEEPS